MITPKARRRRRDEQWDKRIAELTAAGLTARRAPPRAGRRLAGLVCGVVLVNVLAGMVGVLVARPVTIGMVVLGAVNAVLLRLAVSDIVTLQARLMDAEVDRDRMREALEADAEAHDRGLWVPAATRASLPAGDES